ncbi:MAG: hypothetical protein ACFFC7_33840 [Candidatus Hermodarchaeota archaeon]
MWLIKTNSTGYTEWNHTFGGSSIDYADCIISTPDSGYMITGRTESYGAGKSDMWVIKTTANGHLEWNHTFGGPNEEAAYSVIATSDGGYVLVGRTASYSLGEADTWLIKIIFQDETSSSSRSVTGMLGFIVIFSFLVLITVQRKK